MKNYAKRTVPYRFRFPFFFTCRPNTHVSVTSYRLPTKALSASGLLFHVSLTFTATPMRITVPWSILVWNALQVLANVEKTIFLAPPAISISPSHPNLEDLFLDVLTPAPSRWRLRRQVAASFATSTDPRGNETWLLLEGLEEKRRYEVRICWAATVRYPARFSPITIACARQFFAYSIHSNHRSFF